jgi:hypothetical protein
MTETRTRAEHLQWCKDRALAYCHRGDINQAVASMVSDMRKHPETADHPAIEIMFQMHFARMFKSAEECAKYIRGFN